jgi:hypothetical protein
MKKLLAVVVLAILALVAYNYVTTGRIALIPSATMSEQERQINDLLGQARAAATQFAQAGRAAGMSGVDTTAEAEAARQQIIAIQKKAQEIRGKVTDESKAALAKLQLELDKAKSDMGIR